MKASELMKLNVGDSFLMNRPEGPETCTISTIRKSQQYHLIDYRTGRGEATIHIPLPSSIDEELGAVSLPPE
jgi:hypothetical protein